MTLNDVTTEPALATEPPSAEASEPSRIPLEGRAGYRAQPLSFVRRGSRLQGRRQQAWDEHAEHFVIDVPRADGDTTVHPDFRLDPEVAFGRTAPLVLEIGSGLGDAVVHAAQESPKRNFLAVEVYRPGLAQTILRLAQQGLANVRVAQANAPEVLATMLPQSSVDEVWIFFPDPWHKSRHVKRRLVKEGFPELVARALRPGGLWRLATDWEDYAAQMREVIDASPDFVNVHAGDDGDGWAPRFDGRILTSFENKAHRAGRSVFDLAYRRR